jgi:hypothetical protein
MLHPGPNRPANRGEFLRLVAAAARSHTQLAAENLFLIKQLAGLKVA